MTALMITSQEGHIAIIKLLLKYGAKVNMQDIYGQSALMIAIVKMDGLQLLKSY